MEEPKFPIATSIRRPSEYSASELLDRTLEALVIRPENANVSMKKMMTSTDLHKTLFYDRENSLSLDEDEFWSILDKLEDDGFIKKEANEHNTNKIRITFIGLFFVRNGGYAKKQIEDARIAKIEQDQHQMNNRMVYLTAILAAGTLFSSVYYFFQIYDGATLSHKCVAVALLPACLLGIAILLEFQKSSKNQQ